MSGTFSCVYLCFFAESPDSSLSSEFDGREVLLQQTDFQELLKAGRELISKAEWKEFVDSDGHKQRDLVIPKDVNIPDAITELIQKFPDLFMNMRVSNSGCLSISFAKREFGFWGVIILPIDLHKPERDNKYGDKMLIPGLWYYDSWFDEFGPEYERKFDKMIKKNKSLKKKKQNRTSK